MSLSTSNKQYSMKENNGLYYFFDKEGKEITTPGGRDFFTDNKAIADRIIEDLNTYGPLCMQANSILPWHYTYAENFSIMEKGKIEKMLNECFLQNQDWTIGIIQDEGWKVLFGSKKRVKEIRDWMKKCTPLQLTAACCIGNAYHSLNIAYVLANYVENYSGKVLEGQLNDLATMISVTPLGGTKEEMLQDFENFRLYYGAADNKTFGVAPAKEKAKVAWRDSDGRIVCHEELCGDGCNPKCPIHLKTIGDEHIQCNDPKGSIPYYEAALKEADDFEEAWNNLANAYAQLEMHEKALDAFTKSYNLAPEHKKKTRLYCMAVACKYLGRFEDSLKYCDEYASKYGPAEIAVFKAKILGAMK